MGYQLVSNGDVPDENYFNNILMKQGTIVCTSGTRPSSPPEGMFIYETDTDRLLKYTGSAWEIQAGSRTSFTPVLTASSVNPTRGTGAVSFGWYVYGPGPTVTYNFWLNFGTSPSAGTGNYAVSIPVTCANQYAGGHPAVGSVMLADASSGNFTVNAGYIANGGTTLGIVGGSPVTNIFPWTWASGDYIAGTIQYPV